MHASAGSLILSSHGCSAENTGTGRDGDASLDPSVPSMPFTRRA